MRTLEALKKLALKVCTDKNQSDLAGMDTTDKLLKFIAQNYNQYTESFAVPTWRYDIALSDSANAVDYSPDTGIVAGGLFEGYANIITGQSSKKNIYADNSETALDGECHTVEFSPDNTLLAIGGNFTGKAKIYSVSGTNVTYISDIFKDAGTTALDSRVTCVKFSPDGSLLVVCSGNDAYLYSVNGTEVTYQRTIIKYGNTARIAEFSPDGSLLVVCGGWLAKVYSVSGNTVTLIGDIPVDENGSAIENNVYGVAFSNDGTLFAMGGGTLNNLFTKLYSVNGNTITYNYDATISTENSGSLYSIKFANDGLLAVCSGYKANYYKVKEDDVQFAYTLPKNSKVTTEIGSLVLDIYDNQGIVVAATATEIKLYSRP